jgi:uncharacterized protein (DUF2267 family)
VNHDELVTAVAERAGVSRRAADDVVMATLTALAERLTPDETHDLLAQLPKKYKQHVNAVSAPNAMSADEFVARVADLEGDRAPTVDDARRHVAATFATLRDAVNAGELHDVVAQLGDDYLPLLGIERPAAAAALERPSDRDAGAVGRESARNVAGAINDIVRTARHKALDAIVVAVDGLEAVTDRLDDAAEALQERVHRRVDALR